MKKIIRFLSLTVLAFLFAANVFVAGAAQAQTQTPKASVPILLTSCGQSPGPVMLKVFLQKLSLNFDFNVLATAKDIKAKKDAGTPYKSLIVVMGASLKGMGAAGISIEDELKRTAELIDAAKREKITVIGAHIEGLKRRAQGAEAGDTTDEQSIDAVAPKSDMLLINKEGNSDGRFSIIAKEKKIPMIEVEKNLDLLKELEKLFK
jgi:hypothetical protein